MKKVRFTESQIVKILKEFESGIDAQSLCREHGISKAHFIIGERNTPAWKVPN